MTTNGHSFAPGKKRRDCQSAGYDGQTRTRKDVAILLSNHRATGIAMGKERRLAREHATLDVPILPKTATKDSLAT